MMYKIGEYFMGKNWCV